MEALFQSGRVVDLILLLIVIELLALADVLPYLLSGAALLVAVRVALTAGSWPLMALALLFAFAAHLYDLYRRWPRA